jgi:pyruvate dehydrogenase E1 component beta subunit
MLGGQVRVPVVIRQPIGFREGMAAQHSQSTEAWWIHIPGLVVVAPATPADNHGLLKAAIRSDDPVVYMEHKELWTSTGEVDEGAAPAVLGKAAIRRAGSDLTLVTWSGQLGDCLLAAEAAQADGLSIEVIDLRTLWPWDRDTVFDSVARTGRLLVAHQAVTVGGFGAEIVAEARSVCRDAPGLSMFMDGNLGTSSGGVNARPRVAPAMDFARRGD